jgi:hypothetical protein
LCAITRCFGARVCALGGVFSLLAPSASFAGCLQPASTHAWKWGLGGGAAWLQYTDEKSQKPYFSLLRSPVTQIILHDASAAISKTQEVPGFIPFSFEGGFHKENGDQVTAVDGIGVLKNFPDGRVGLVTGNLDHADNGVQLLRRASLAIHGAFRFYVDDTCYQIPMGDEALKVMQVLFLPHPRFKQEASKLFLK